MQVVPTINEQIVVSRIFLGGNGWIWGSWPTDECKEVRQYERVREWMNQGSLAMLGLGGIDDTGNEEQSMNSWK